MVLLAQALSASIPPLFVIGADPGKSGALVALRCSDMQVLGAVAANVAPFGWWTKKAKGQPSERAAAALRELLQSAGLDAHEGALVVEHQWVEALDGGNAAQVRDQGTLEGVAAGMGMEVHVIRAQAWRTVTGTSSGDYRKNKAASTAFCRARLPGLDLTPGRLRTPHEGLADAACIAWYGVKKWGVR